MSISKQEIDAIRQHVERMNDIDKSTHYTTVLLDEVERLQADNELNANYVEIYKDICDKYGENFRALLDKAKALQSENVTMKMALKYAKAERDAAMQYVPVRCKTCAKDCAYRPKTECGQQLKSCNYWQWRGIQQAKEENGNG